MPSKISRTNSTLSLSTPVASHDAVDQQPFNTTQRHRDGRPAQAVTDAAPSLAKRALLGLTRFLAVQGVSGAGNASSSLSMLPPVQDTWNATPTASPSVGAPPFVMPSTTGRHLLAEAQPFYNFMQGAGGTNAPTSNVLQPAVSTFDPLKPAPALPLLAGTGFGSLPPGFQVLPRGNVFDYTHIIQGQLNNCWLLSSMIATVQSGSLLTATPISATEEPGVFSATFYRRKVVDGVAMEGQENIRVRNQLPFRGKHWDLDNNAWSGSPGYRLAWPAVWVKAFVAFNNRYPMPQVQTVKVRGMQILDTPQSTKTPLYMLTGKRPKQLDNDGTHAQADFTAIAQQKGSAKTALTYSCGDIFARTGPSRLANFDGVKVYLYRNPLIGDSEEPPFEALDYSDHSKPPVLRNMSLNALAYGEGPLPARSAVSLTCGHYYVLLGVNNANGYFRFHNPVGKNQVWTDRTKNQGKPEPATYNPVLELPFDVVKWAFKSIIYT